VQTQAGFGAIVPGVMFQRILVSIDGSTYADHALSQAIELAEAGHGQLTIITAVHVPNWLGETALGSVLVAAQVTVELERESTEILRQAEMRVPESVPVTTILSREPIRQALQKATDSGRYDLVAIGSRGRGAVRAAVLGSVSHHLLNHSPIPVLIVPGNWAGPMGDVDRPALSSRSPSRDSRSRPPHDPGPARRRQDPAGGALPRPRPGHLRAPFEQAEK
jgi:nucleotide-binding universal stress UspA family protein